MKKGAAGSGTIRQKRPNLWEGRVTAGVDPATGKQRQVSIYGRTQKEVRKKMTAAAAAVDTGANLLTRKKELSFGEWAQLWLSTFCTGVRPNTRENYEQMLTKHLLPRFGGIKLTAINRDMLQAFFNASELSPKSKQCLRSVLHAIMEEAALSGRITTNPVNRLKLPRVTLPEIPLLESDQVAAFFKACDADEKYGDLLKLVLMTGLRISEILGITWSCVDFASGTVLVDHQLGNGELTPLKAGTGRTIRPGETAMMLLMKRKAHQDACRAACDGMWIDNLGLAFTDEIGTPYNRITAYSHCRTIGKMIGVPDLHPHALRHNYITLAIEAGVNFKTIQAAVGHASLQMTMDTYARLTHDMQVTAADKMSEFFKKISP